MGQIRIKINNQRGQVAIVLVMVAAIITILFVHVAFINISALTRSNEVFASNVLGARTEGVLESGAMRFLRDPTYAGEELNVGTASCTISVQESMGVITIEASCMQAGRTKIASLTVVNNGGIFEFSKIE